MKNGPYTLSHAPGDYPGKKYRGLYCYEHQLVWWKKTGKLVPPGYEIHHKNGNHRDNLFSNLALLTSVEHRRLHAKMASEKARVSVICFGCSKSFFKKRRDVNFKKKNNKFGLFCTRKCLYKWQTGRKTAG